MGEQCFSYFSTGVKVTCADIIFCGRIRAGDITARKITEALGKTICGSPGRRVAVKSRDKRAGDVYKSS